jgi:hypothetical protein
MDFSASIEALRTSRSIWREGDDDGDCDLQSVEGLKGNHDVGEGKTTRFWP